MTNKILISIAFAISLTSSVVCTIMSIDMGMRGAAAFFTLIFSALLLSLVTLMRADYK